MPDASAVPAGVGMIPEVGAGGPPDPCSAPISAYRYLDAKRDVIDREVKARPLIRLWDNHMRYIGTVAAEKSIDAEELLHDSGQADIVLRADDWIVDFLRRDVRKDEDLHVTIDPYPHRRNWRWRWGGKVVNVQVKRDESGLRTVTLQCIHNREHWKHLYFGATPFCDPSLQPLKAWLLPGNTRTIISITGFVNLARNYWPLLALPAQLLNPGAWVSEGVLDLGNLSPLNWPVQMQYVGPLRDQSRFSVVMSRWAAAHSVTEALLRDAGCNLRAYTWLPEDEDSPHPELADLIGQKAARPSRACVVLAVEDNAGVTGPTGTALDGAINLIAATADNLVTETLVPVDKDGDGVTDPFFRKIFGVAPKVPDVTFRDTEYSAIMSSEHSMFRSKASKILTGGKSPGWVNQAQTFAIKYALSQIQTVIVAGVFGSEGGPPIGAGLDDLYQGQFDDTLLAFIEITDPVRAARAGAYGFLEHFEQGSGSAWTVASALTLREGHYKTRPYQGFKVQIRNGGDGHQLYYDFDLGDRCHFENDGVLHTDQITAIKLHYDESTPKTFDLSIGDDRESENPIAAATRSLGNLWSAVGLLFGSGDMF